MVITLNHFDVSRLLLTFKACLCLIFQYCLSKDLKLKKDNRPVFITKKDHLFDNKNDQLIVYIGNVP